MARPTGITSIASVVGLPMEIVSVYNPRIHYIEGTMDIRKWIIGLGFAPLIASCSWMGPSSPTVDRITEARRNSPIEVKFRGVGPIGNDLLEVVQVRPVSITEVPFPERKRYRVQGRTVLALRAGGAASYEFLQQRAAEEEGARTTLAEHYRQLEGKIGLRFAKDRMESWKAGEQETFKDDFVIEWCKGAWRHIDTDCGSRPVEVISMDRLQRMQRSFEERLASEEVHKEIEQRRLEQSEMERRLQNAAELDARKVAIRADLAELQRCTGHDGRAYSMECFRPIQSSLSKHVSNCSRSASFARSDDPEDLLCSEVSSNYTLIDDFRRRDGSGRPGAKLECLEKDCFAEISDDTKIGDQNVRVFRATIGMSGPVLVGVDVSAEGVAGAVQLMQSSGSVELDNWVTARAQRWHYHPATEGHAMRDGQAKVVVSFEVVAEDPTYGSLARVTSVSNWAGAEDGQQ